MSTEAVVREVEVQGRNLRIHEGGDIDSGKAGTGSWVWDAAIVLAKYFDTPAWKPDALKGKRVVELGAGVGLGGLAAACLGADVILTDRADLIPGIQRNIDSNGFSQSVRAQVLNWGEDCSSLDPPADVVIGSDIMYDMVAMPALIDTIRALSAPHTQIILAYELRFGTTDSFPLMVSRGLPWTRVPPEKLHPDWRSDDIGIFILHKDEISEKGEETRPFS